MSETRRILLVSGHGAGDSGATGSGYREDVETRRMTTAIFNHLNGKIPVTMYPQSRNLVRTNDHSQYKNHNVIEFHLNAFNGTARGTEILIREGLQPSSMGNAMLGVLSKYFVNRGFKRRNNLGNMNKFHAMGGTGYQLIETCFIDNKSDMDAYEKNFNAIALELANVILAAYGKSIITGTGNLNGWIKDNKGWRYWINGSMAPEGDWRKIEGHTFYFGKDGYILQEKWHKYRGDYYWLDKDGRMACKGWLQIAGVRYYFEPNGKLREDKFFDDGTGMFYVQKGGGMVTGLRTIKGKMYLFDSNGRLYRNYTIGADGVWTKK